MPGRVSGRLGRYPGPRGEISTRVEFYAR